MFIQFWYTSDYIPLLPKCQFELGSNTGYFQNKWRKVVILLLVASFKIHVQSVSNEYVNILNITPEKVGAGGGGGDMYR